MCVCMCVFTRMYACVYVHRCTIWVQYMQINLYLFAFVRVRVYVVHIHTHLPPSGPLPGADTTLHSKLSTDRTHTRLSKCRRSETGPHHFIIRSSSIKTNLISHSVWLRWSVFSSARNNKSWIGEWKWHMLKTYAGRKRFFFPNLYISNSYCIICIQHFIDFRVILFNGPITFSRLNAKECYYQLIIFFYYCWFHCCW